MRQSSIMREISKNQATEALTKKATDWYRQQLLFVRFCAIAALFYCATLLTTCSPTVTTWQQIKASGKLRVVTRENPSTYFEIDGEPQGFEFDLITAFAQQAGLEIEFYTAPVQQIITDLENKRAQIAAAGLTITPARKDIIDFGHVYQEVEQVVIGRRIRGLPKDISLLSKYEIAVIAESSHVERLVQIKQSFPELEWKADENADTMSLLQQVQNKEIDLTIVDSNEFAVAQRYFPDLAKAFTLSEPQQLAWAIQKDSPKLLSTVNLFFQEYEQSGRLDKLKETNFGFIKAFDFVELVSFIKHRKQRLPEFIDYFMTAAQRYELDWRFIAAISYQESHWRPDAVSPTGVKGMMMLTKNAAQDMQIENREDPLQSIIGGTGYFLKILNKIPPRISEPDRTWLALAGYNVGFGHLEDARILTQRAGKNPDLWKDVEEHLPLLEEKKYYSTVKRGKARGSEPVKYVNNIRDYYDLLKWAQQNDSAESQSTAANSQNIESENDKKSGRNILQDIFSPDILKPD